MPGMLLPQIAHRHPNLCEQLDMLESQVLALAVATRIRIKSKLFGVQIDGLMTSSVKTAS